MSARVASTSANVPQVTFTRSAITRPSNRLPSGNPAGGRVRAAVRTLTQCADDARSALRPPMSKRTLQGFAGHLHAKDPQLQSNQTCHADKWNHPSQTTCTCQRGHRTARS